MTRALALLVGAAVLVAVPAAAQAHSSRLRPAGSTLVYDQFRIKPEREKNTLTISDGTGDLAGYWKFTDPRTRGIVNTIPCIPLDAKDLEVACPSDFFTSMLVRVSLNNDRVVLKIRKPATVRGGPGSDTLIGGPGPARLYGETGSDRLVAGPRGGALLVGGTGIDVLDARNGRRDQIVRCGDDEVKRDRVDRVTTRCG